MLLRNSRGDRSLRTFEMSTYGGSDSHVAVRASLRPRMRVTTKVDKSALVCLFYFTLNLVKLTPTSLLKFLVFFVVSLSSFTYDENKVAVILKCVVHR